MSQLQGNWNYRSFCPFPAMTDRTKTPPVVSRLPLLAGPWTPLLTMELITDTSGKVTGSATLGPLRATIEGTVKAETDGVPETVELAVTVEGGAAAAVYHLQGCFLADSDHIVGTVVSLGNDLAMQPIGTSGSFVLYPSKP
jgi:hypothetical protein